ncbi:FAD-dependent oxidoreductase [Paenibacillus sp. sgz5001063]|uniref:FAD-dependent oxidoreductase n=1 Tax=Paenibacillus sp. sgz5001063 TaxID=3242474 RepID=UPI0036D35FDB
MRQETIHANVTVIGGGLAGVCAAIAAARLGQQVALVHNRPVLGGNSSSEVRVWVCGATAHGNNRYARETGIMGELFIENQYRNPEGNPYIWDLTILEAVRAESNIQLFLNTDVRDVETNACSESKEITSVSGWMMGSERQLRFESDMFLDCTGDGLIGFLAGAQYRLGREAQHEYNESWAPLEADEITLGSTILFYTKDAGEPITYVAPSFAKDITSTSIPVKRVIKSGTSGCHYWWIEWGGELDTVHDNEHIRDELWAVIYGIWDYIKNSGKFPEAANMTLEWIGSCPGKREYRRFVGDYVLNQNDIIAQREFNDRIAFGGWSIDLHPPQGVYSTESGSKHMQPDGIYHIPFRSLYSANVSNLLFAGRNISASHVAFGTTRVMATCAVIGEAAGTGAALAVQHRITPRSIAEQHVTELQQTLLRQDASLIGVRNIDEQDKARTGTITSSSSLRKLACEQQAEAHQLTTDIGLLIPVAPELQRIELLVDSASDTILEIQGWSTGRAENYIPHQLEIIGSTSIVKGDTQWVSIDLPWKPDVPQNIFIIIKENPALNIYASREPLTGVLSFSKLQRHVVSTDLEDRDIEQPLLQWNRNPFDRHPVCFRAYPDTEAYSPDHIIDGYARPYGVPHLWISEPLIAGQEAYLELSWQDQPRPVIIDQIHITLNDDVNEDLINLHHHKTPFRVIPELVKSYRLEALSSDGVWILLAHMTNNHKRKHIHTLEQSIAVTKLRITVEATNGCSSAEIIEIRVY